MVGRDLHIVCSHVLLCGGQEGCIGHGPPDTPRVVATAVCVQPDARDDVKDSWWQRARIRGVGSVGLGGGWLGHSL